MRTSLPCREAVAQMRANQIWQVGRMFLQGLQKEPRASQLVLVGRVPQQFERFGVCGFFLAIGVFEIHALERIFIGEQHAVVERKLSVESCVPARCD